MDMKYTKVIASFYSYFLQNTQFHHSTHHTFCWLPPTPQVPSCVVLSIPPAHKVTSKESIVNTEENLEMSHIMDNASMDDLLELVSSDSRRSKLLSQTAGTTLAIINIYVYTKRKLSVSSVGRCEFC